MPEVQRLMTVDQMAEWLQVKPRTIYQWVHEGYIPVIKLGALVRFDQASVGKWLRTRETTGRVGRRLDLDLN